MSVRQDALAVLKTRLESIKKPTFQTDAGLSLFIGQKSTFGPSDPDDSIAMLPQQDVPGHQMARAVTTLPVHVEIVVKAQDRDEPWDTVEAIIADVRKAVETDHDLEGNLLRPRGLQRGPTVPHDRDAGSEFVGATMEYRLEFVEDWGNP